MTPWPLPAVALVAALGMMTLVWVASLVKKDASIIDNFWGLGFVWWTVFSRILMTRLLMRVSGVTLLEKRLEETKPAYREYAERTNAFFPWVPASGPPEDPGR